jgi:WD40 repeat protein
MGNCCSCCSDDIQFAPTLAASPEPVAPEENDLQHENSCGVASNPLSAPTSRRTSARSTGESSALAASLRRLSSLRGMALVNTKEADRLVDQLESAFATLAAIEQQQYEDEVSPMQVADDGPFSEHYSPPSHGRRSVSVDAEAVESAAAMLQKLVDEAIDMTQRFCGDPALTVDKESPALGVLQKSHLVSDETSQQFSTLHRQLSEVLQVLRPDSPPSPSRSLSQIRSQSFREVKRIAEVIDANREMLEISLACTPGEDRATDAADLPQRLKSVALPLVALFSEVPDVASSLAPLLGARRKKGAPAALETLWAAALESASPQQVVAVIGSYGSGKTTFLKQAFCREWERFITCTSQRSLTLYVDLRQFIGKSASSVALKSLVLNALQQRLGKLTAESINCIRQGRILLLLDSYGDFVASRRRRIFSVRRREEPADGSSAEPPWSVESCTDVLLWPCITVVVAARPEQIALRSESEISLQRMGVKKLFILPLTVEKRDDIAERFSRIDIGSSHTAAWYISQLQELPVEISLNPLFLRMSLETLSAVSTCSFTANTSAAEVLAAYCIAKGGERFAEHRAECSVAANAFLVAGVRCCEKSDPLWLALTACAERNRCSPFLANTGGCVEFRHDIFLDYFGSIDSRCSEFLRHCHLNASDGMLVHCLAHRARSDGDFLSQLLAHLDESRHLYSYSSHFLEPVDCDERARAASNALTIVTASRSVLHGADLSHIVAPGSLLHDECRFVSCSFLGADLSFSTVGALQAIDTSFECSNFFGVRHCGCTSAFRLFSSHGHQGSITAVCSDEGVVASASADGSVCMWDPATGSHSAFHAHAGGVLRLRMGHIGSRSTLLTCGTADRTVTLWVVADRKAVPARSFAAPLSNPQVVFASHDPDAGVVSARCCDGSSILWDAFSSEVVSTVPGRVPTMIEGSADGLLTCSWTQGHTFVRLQQERVSHGKQFSILQSEVEATVVAAALSSDGELFGMMLSDGSAELFTILRGSVTATFCGRIEVTRGCQAVWGRTAGRCILATFGSDEGVYLHSYTAEDGNPLATRGAVTALLGHVATATCATFASSSSQGLLLISGSSDGSIVAWSASSGCLLWASGPSGATPSLLRCSFSGASVAASTMRDLRLELCADESISQKRVSL